MVLMAIDGSTKSTGAAIFKDGELIHYFNPVAASNKLFNRIHKMVDELKAAAIEYKVDTVIMEEVLPENGKEEINKNKATFKALMYLQAEVVDMFDELGIKVEFLFPGEWRSRCGIKTGRGVKRDMQKEYDIAYVKVKYKLDVNDDVADAIGIGCGYLAGEKKVRVVDGFEFG